MTSNSPPPLRGIIPPMITPLRDRDTLDESGLERLVEHMLGGGVHGLFVLGTTGEGPALSHRLQRDVVEHTLRLVRGRVPVLVCITDPAFVESLQLARFAADHGARAVVVAPPYYLPPGQAELWEYLTHLVAELPLPVFLYNMPGLTKVSFDPATVARARELRGVVGMKDSSGDMIYLHRMLELAAERPDWSVFVGPEELTAEAVLMGAHGGINGGANLHPRLYVELYEAAAGGDLQRVRELHRRVLRLAADLYTLGRHRSSYIKGIKCGLSLLGVCDDFMAEPAHRFREPERSQVRERMVGLGLLPA